MFVPVTKIPAINRSIEKFYNNRRTQKFPDYREMFEIVETTNDVKNLGLSADKIEETGEHSISSTSLRTCRYCKYRLSIIRLPD